MKKYLLFLLIALVSLLFFACNETNPSNDNDKEEPTEEIKPQDDDKNNDGDKPNEDNGDDDPNNKEEKCLVSFYLDNELFISSEIKKDTKVARPNDPEIENAIFDGWFTAEDTEWNFDTVISSDLSLYGKYHYEEVINVSYKIYGEDEMYVGYIQQLSFVKRPADVEASFTWRSSDEDVAKVDENGIVTACGAGTAKIMIVDEKGKVKATFRIKVEEDISDPLIPNMGGYEIIIMNAESALTDDNPFLDRYTKPDKIYKQKAWREIESEYNCKITVAPYPAEATWGDPRVEWIKSNVIDNKSECDIAVINGNWLPELARTDCLINVSEYYRLYGKKQMDKALKEAGTYKGKLYVATTGITTTVNNVDIGLYYNYGMVKRLGLDDPAALFNEGKWNYTGFEAWVREAQEKIGDDKYALGGHPYYYYYGMTNAAGVKIADTAVLKSNVLTDAPRNAMNLLKKLASDGCVCDDLSWNEVPSASGPDWFNGGVLMTTGVLWFIKAPSRWDIHSFEWEDEVEIGYAPFPYPDELNKEDTRVGISGFSTYVFLSGRNYPQGANAENVYMAITEMFLRTSKYLEADEEFDAYEYLFNSLKKRIDNDASIEAMLYFDSNHTLYDPAHAMYGSTGGTTLRQPSIDAIFGNEEYDEVFGKVSQKFESEFLNYFG